MIPFLSRTLAAALLAATALVAHAQAPQPPEVAAKAYLLMDVTAGQVLVAKEPDAPVEPASLTKLMTAYLVFDALKAKKISLTQTLPVSERAWKMPGSRMFIDPKMQVPVDDLRRGHLAHHLQHRRGDDQEQLVHGVVMTPAARQQGQQALAEEEQHGDFRQRAQHAEDE